MTKMSDLRAAERVKVLVEVLAMRDSIVWIYYFDFLALALVYEAVDFFPGSYSRLYASELSIMHIGRLLLLV